MIGCSVISINKKFLSIQIFESSTRDLIIFFIKYYASGFRHCEIRNTLKHNFENKFFFFGYLNSNNLFSWKIKEFNKSHFHLFATMNVFFVFKNYYSSMFSLTFKIDFPIMTDINSSVHFRVNCSIEYFNYARIKFWLL